MKERYEDRTRYFLPRRTYTIIRLDGKAFHTYTRGMEKPYSELLTNAMDFTAINLCKEIQGVKFAYTQSDEISLLLTDFSGPETQAWFDGNIQKIVSVAASIATVHFNNGMMLNSPTPAMRAMFDARVFTIPDRTEVANYFIWRQQDAVRNSIQMLAQSLYSHKQLEGKNSSELQELTFQKGKNWNDVAVRNKRGGFVAKKEYQFINPPSIDPDHTYRYKWEQIECPHFTVDELKKYIPKQDDY